MPASIALIVTTGAIAFRSACERITRSSDAPFARAVRTHGSSSTSSMRARTMRMYSATKKSAKVSHGSTRCSAHAPTPPHGSGVPAGAKRCHATIAAAEGRVTVQ